MLIVNHVARFISLHKLLFIFEYGLRFILSFVFTAILVRNLEFEVFGSWSMALVYFAFAASFSKLGMNDVVVKKLVIDEFNRSVNLGTSFWLKIIMATLVIFGYYIFSFFNENLSQNILGILLFMLVFQSMEVADFYFQSIQKYVHISVIKIVQVVIGFSLKVAILFHFRNIEILAWVLVLESAFLAFLQFAAMYKAGHGLFIGYFSLSVARGLLKESLPLLLTGVSVFLYTRLDQMIIFYLMGAEDVAIYSIAIRVVEMVYVIPSMLLGLVYPMLLSKSKDSKDSLVIFLRRLVRYSLFLTIILGLLLLLFSRIFIVSVYGINYAEAGNLIWPLSLNVFFVCLGLMSNALIVVNGSTKHLLYRSFLTLVVNVLLNVVLIRCFDLLGGVLAVLITYLIQVLFIDRLFPVTNDFRRLWIDTIIMLLTKSKKLWS